MEEIAESIEYLTRTLDSVAEAITPYQSTAEDAVGGYVGSLTEAVMGVTAGLVKIAEAIGELAEAVRGREG